MFALAVRCDNLSYVVGVVWTGFLVLKVWAVDRLNNIYSRPGVVSRVRAWGVVLLKGVGCCWYVGVMGTGGGLD